MTKKNICVLLLIASLMISLSGCGLFDSTVNELRGDITGNTYTIDTFDNFGKNVMTTRGQKINVTGNIVDEHPIHQMVDGVQ